MNLKTRGIAESHMKVKAQMKKIRSILSLVTVVMFPFMAQAVNPPYVPHAINADKIKPGDSPVNNTIVCLGAYLPVDDGKWECSWENDGDIYPDIDSVNTSVADWHNVPITWSGECVAIPAVSCSTSETRRVAVVKMGALEYLKPDGSWVDATSGILYVAKGSSMTFRATPFPAVWPSGMPVWSGSSGATGGGTIKTITFDTVSASSADYKTVTVSCGDSKSANIIVIKVDMSINLWWFNGENPGGGYHITSTLIVTPVTTGTFKWDVIAGADKVNLNNGGADADTITATDDNTIDVKSTAASAGAATVTKDVRIQLAYNDVAVCTYDLAVFAPDHLVHLRDDDAVDATGGYCSMIHYRIEDQFNQTLPHIVALNEDFTAAPIADNAGMDWRRRPASGATVNPADWCDKVTGETSRHTPTPLGPTDPGAGTKVYHWPGTWNIGSTSISNGVTVGSAHWANSPICVWQKYRGYADHE